MILYNKVLCQWGQINTKCKFSALSPAAKRMCFHFHIGRCLTGCHSSPNFFLPARAASLQFFRNFHTSESSFSLGALLTAQICSPLPQDSAQKSWSHVNHISIKLEKKRREENRREKKGNETETKGKEREGKGREGKGRASFWFLEADPDNPRQNLAFSSVL